MKKKKKSVDTSAQGIEEKRAEKKKRIYLICDARYRKKVSFIMCSRKIVSLTYKKKKTKLKRMFKIFKLIFGQNGGSF